MRFDWKDLSLWCFCSFYFGMLLGPIFFLDADALKWVGACGAALGATVAIGGYVINVSINRNQRKLADRAEFDRVWSLFARGAVTTSQLFRLSMLTMSIAKKAEADEVVTFKDLQYLTAERLMNINIEDDAFSYQNVEVVRNYLDTFKQSVEKHETTTEIDPEHVIQLHQMLETIAMARDTIANNVVLPHFKYLEARDVLVMRTPEGNFTARRVNHIHPPLD